MTERDVNAGLLRKAAHETKRQVPGVTKALNPTPAVRVSSET